MDNLKMEEKETSKLVEEMETLIESGQWTLVKKVANLLLDRNEEYAAAYNALAIVKIEAENDYEFAKDVYYQAITHEPNSATLYYNLGVLCDRFLQQAEDAIFAFEKAILIKPDFVDAYVDLIELYFELNIEGDKALNYALKVEALAPNNARNLNNIGCYYIKKHQDYEQAIMYFNKALVCTSNKALIAANLADAYVKVTQYEEARKAYELSLSLEPNNSLVCHNFAHILHHHLKEIELAKVFYDRAISLNPKEIHPYMGLKNIYLNHEHDPQRAVTILVEALENVVVTEQLILEIADIYDVALEDYNEAMFYYQLLLKKNPYHLTALNALAYLYVEISKDYERAITCYQTIMEVDSENPIVYVNMGHIYFVKLSDFSQAFLYYEKAEKMIEEQQLNVPYAKELYYYIGLIYENYFSQQHTAINYYEKAVGLQGHKLTEKKLLMLYGKSVKIIN